MSKAFTSEETVDAPEVIAPLPPLPLGTKNHVTPTGLEQLKDRLSRARSSRADARRISELEQRLASARVVDPKTQPRGEVRFGATVKVRSTAGVERTFQLVGVDEADVARGKIAFVAPLARALLGKGIGDTASVPKPQGDDELEVLSISYD